jgi:hypothetical protein
MPVAQSAIERLHFSIGAAGQGHTVVDRFVEDWGNNSQIATKRTTKSAAETSSARSQTIILVSLLIVAFYCSPALPKFGVVCMGK